MTSKRDIALQDLTPEVHTEIGIDWPIEHPILSAKDAGLPPLREVENNFIYQAEEVLN